MSHPGSVDIIDFILLTIYPVGALLIKLSVQGITMIGFAFAYTIFISLITTSSDEHIFAEPHWLSAFVLIALSVTLFYQAHRSKQDPTKSDY